MRSKVLQVQKRGSTSVLSPERLFCIALLQLYCPDDGTTVLNGYRKQRYRANAFISECVKGEHKPGSTSPFQQELQRLCPRATRINLYIAAQRRGIPSHAISLVRDEKGRFRASSVRMRLIIDGNPPRDGILASWSDTPDPDNAVVQPMHLTRVTRGGRSCTELIQEVETDYELSRQLTYAHLVAEVCGTTSTRINVWHSDSAGKATFKIVTHNTQTPSEQREDVDPFITPHTFEGLRIRGDAKPGAKPNCKIYCDVPSDDLVDYRGIQPRYFGTEIKDAVPFDLSGTSQFIIPEILKGCILPFVGIVTDESSPANVLAMNYDPMAKELWATSVAILKQRQGEIPLLMPKGSLLLPNSTMLQSIMRLLSAPKAATAYQHDLRIELAVKITRSFSRKYSFLELCERQNIVLTSEDQKAIKRLGLNQLP